MSKKVTPSFLAAVCFLGLTVFGETIQLQILTPVKRGRTTQIVPQSFEIVSKTRANSPRVVLMESPFPGLEVLKIAQGMSTKVFKDASGSLFEEIEIELADKRKKRVYQKLLYGGPEVITGQFQRLQPVSRNELARFFIENFTPEKSVENYSKTIFSMQNVSDKKNVFTEQCRFLKQQQSQVLEQVKIEKVVFDLLLEGTCP